jgi:hypothetical protein
MPRPYAASCGWHYLREDSNSTIPPPGIPALRIPHVYADAQTSVTHILDTSLTQPQNGRTLADL